MHLVNGAQFSNITPLFLSSAFLAAASSHAPVIVIALLTNLIFFDIPLLYCYTNLNSSIPFFLSSGDIYLFFGAPISSFCNSLERLFGVQLR